MIRLFVVLALMVLPLGLVAQQQDDVAQSNLQSTAPNLQCSMFNVQSKYDLFFLEAMMQRQKGNNDAVFDLLRHCISLRPDAAEAYYFLAQYYQLMKQDSLAMVNYQRASDLEPNNATFLETIAQTYASSHDYDKAITAFDRLYNLDKSREDLLELLFELYRLTDRNEEAIAALNRMEAAEGKSERLAIAKSDIYSKMGNHKAAIAEVEALAQRYPNDLNYRGMLADQLLRNDEDEKALAIYEQILAEEPDNVRAQVSLRSYYQALDDTVKVDSLTECILLGKNTTTDQRVYILRQMIGDSEQTDGDSTQILSTFRKVLSLPQPDVNVAALCVAYMNLKRMPHDSVKPMLQTMLTIAPDNAAARLQLVSYAWDDKRLDDVISLCYDARQYNPEEMAFYYYQGMAYYQKEDKDKALEAFQNGISVITPESDPAIVSDFYAVMGDLLHQKGMARQAFEAYDSCLQWKDDNVMCLNNYAYYLSELNEQLDKAEQMSYKTIKAEPKNATYLDTYAWILFMQERYAEAKVYIDQAVQNDSDSSAVIFEHAGDIYYFNEQPERAVELWQQALLQDSRNKLVARKIKRKKYLRK